MLKISIFKLTDFLFDLASDDNHYCKSIFTKSYRNKIKDSISFNFDRIENRKHLYSYMVERGYWPVTIHRNQNNTALFNLIN